MYSGGIGEPRRADASLPGAPSAMTSASTEGSTSTSAFAVNAPVRMSSFERFTIGKP
jgi:hypothetical protein